VVKVLLVNLVHFTILVLLILDLNIYNRCKYLRAPTPRQGYEQVRVGWDFIYILLLTIFENLT
jgi:hypothetical protein